VRGFARPGDYNTRVLLLVNGHRLNDNIDDGATIGTEFPLDIDLVERIEIVRGPGSSLYGTNALFGVINVITRQPQLTPTVEASVEGETRFTRKARISLGLPNILDGVLLSASMYRSNGNQTLYFPEFDSPDTNNGVAQRVDGDRYSSAFALIRWKHFQLQNLIGLREKIIPTASFGTTFNDPGSRTTNTAAFSELTYQRDFTSGLQLTSRWFYDAFTYHGTYAYQIDGARAIAYDNARSDSVGTETHVSLPLGHRNIVTGGTEFRYNLRQAQQDGMRGSPTLDFDSQRQSSVFAFYAQDELHVTSRLLVNAGLRFDSYSTFGATMSPRIAAIFHADQKTAIKYSFGHAFRAPSAYEMFYSDGVTQEANPGLRPETIASQNVGVERVLTPRFRIVAEAFYNSLSQMLNEEIDPVSGMYHFVNVSSSSGKGLEFELDAQHKGARGELSYTVQRSVDRLANVELANSPQHMAKLKLHASILPTLLAGFDLQYMSPQRSPSNVRIPDSLTMNLTLSTRKPILGFDLSGSCYNLFNRRNYDPPSPSLVETRLLQDGRGFRLQVTRGISKD
jgi:iron complex outermembrane receptor protein